MKYRFLMVPALLALSSVGFAIGQNQLVRMAGQYNMLSADIGMMGYDPENIQYIEQARETYEVVADEVSGWIDVLPEDQRALAEQEWESFSAIIEGKDGYPGMLELSSIDGVNVNDAAAQRIHYDTLQGILFKAPQLSDAQLSDLQRLYMKLSGAVSAYVAMTSNPFGSMAMSMNDGDLKLVTLTSEIDQLFNKLIKESQDEMRTAQLRRQESKWQFIRSTIAKGSQSAMPYIVRYQGKQIIEDLSYLFPSDEEPAMAP